LTPKKIILFVKFYLKWHYQNDIKKNDLICNIIGAFKRP
jgi:hypothetical protein